MLPDLNLKITSVIVFAVWNIIVFAMYGLDKRKAKLKKPRISERTLITSALLMGGFGAFLGMRVFRHKTKHLEFKLGVPLLLILNIICIAIFIYRFTGIL